MRGSIRTRLLAGTALAVSLMFALSGILVYVLTRSSLRDEFDTGLASRAHALTALIEQDGATIESDLGREETARELHELWHDDGKVVRRSTSLGGRDLERTLAPGSVAGTIVLGSVTLPDGSAGRQITIVFHPRQDAEDAPLQTPSTLALAVAQPTDEVDATVARLGRILIVVGFVATLLCVGLLAWIVRYGLAPVRSLAGAIAELREEKLATRLDAATSPQELRPVVERLNDLLRRLEVAFTRERELTAEVAHELRTPMAGLRVTIELALDRERTPERYRAALADCLAICTQTERMVESLLSLARLDAGMVAAKREPVEVDALVREVIERHASRANERRLSIESELAATTLVTDREKLAVVVGNLLDNAVAYADEGGTIGVELGATLRISNTGCALSAEELGHVFDRFWRADQARSAGTHAGIGLALSKKLVELLGGTLVVEAREGRFVATVAFSV